jgi:hypothetical protein
MFWHNEEYATGLGRDICLDGVVCVVDAVFGQKVTYCHPCSRFSDRTDISKQMEDDSAVEGEGESLR